MGDCPADIDRLKSQILSGGPLAVAYSGGVDSTFLVAVAREVLGDGVIAVTADTPLMPAREIDFAADTAAVLGVRQVMVAPPVMDIPELVANPPHRCYICKKIVFTMIAHKAAELGFHRLAHGANLDDLKDYRPGMKAADELGVEAPLVNAGFAKQDIRRMSRSMGLPTWDRPAAACLASRVPYGTPLTAAALSMIDEAEATLQGMGIVQCRVRVHGHVARIEVHPSDMKRVTAPEFRERIVSRLREIGFTYVALDLEGYAMGSMNRSLPVDPGAR